MKFNKPTDIIIAGPKLNETENAAVRIRDNEISFGSISAAKEGATPEEGSEVLEMRVMGDSPVAVVVKSTKVGPAKYNNNEFRTGWENIFGKKDEVAQA